MVNSSDFVGRLNEILSYYGLSASGFADKIKVQRSSISHLLSGRNKPSLDFVLKVINVFPEVNLYWLLNGKGSFPSTKTKEPSTSKTEKRTSTTTIPPQVNATPKTGKKVEKVIIFYTDGTFDSYVQQ